MRTDVTAERTAERALRRSEERFRHLAEASPNGLLVADEDGTITFVNRAVEALFGYARGALLGQPVEALMPADERREHVALRAAYADAPAPRHLDTGREVLGLRADGSTVPIEIGLTPFTAEGSTVVLATIVDLTARRAAEAALRESEERLQTVVENLDEGLIIADLDGNVLHWNRAALTLHGFTSLEEGQRALPAFQEVFALLTPEGEPVPFEDWPLPRIFGGEALSGLVLRLRRVGGDWERTFRYGGTTALDAAGRPVAFLTVADVTEQRAAEDALRRRAAELQSITDHTDDVIARLDRDLRYLFVNPAIERLTGHPPEVFIGKTLHDLAPDPTAIAAWVDHLEGALLSGEPRDVTSEREQGGRRQYLHARIVPERGADGAVETLLVVTHDVTAQRLAADALRESEERFREVVERSPSGIVVADAGGRITMVNRRVEELFGYARAEILGGPVERLVPPRFGAHATSREAFQTNPEARPMGVGRDLYARRKDGSEFPVEIALTPIETDAGPAVLATVVDITKRKAAEAALRASEERMRGVLEATPDAFFAVDRDWRFTYVNPHAEALWGVEAGALLGQTMAEAFPGITETPFYRAYARVMRTRHPAVVTAQGGETGPWYEAHAFPYETGIAVFFSDVTARKQAEAALVRKEAETRRLAMAAARTTNGVLIADAEGRIEWANEGFTRMSGYAADEVVGQPLADVLRGPDTDPDRAALLQGHLILGEGFTAEVVNYRKDGTPYWVHLDAQPLRDAAGRLSGFIRIDTDVTERKRAEEALRESEGRFRRATEAAHVGVFELDLSTRTLRWSAHTHALFGLDPDAPPLTLARFLSLVHADDRDAVARLITAAVHPSAPQRFEGQCRVVWPDASVRWLALRGDVVHAGAGEERRPARVMGVALDVTERQRYEDELVAAREQAEEAARLKAALLANMSHEIRTPLTGIIGFAEVLGEEVSGEPAEFAGLIRRSGQRLLETLNSVLDLSRLEAARLTLAARPTDLAAAAHDAATLYGAQAEERGLRLVVEAPASAPVLADEGALARVLANLLSNALKFTPRGEVALRVSTEGAPGAPDGYGVVAVADTGTGIAPAFLPHLFNEFEQESTGLDRTYEGAGLGLTLTKRLVELMGGTISVESEKGVGSTFTVRLPLA